MEFQYTTKHTNKFDNSNSMVKHYNSIQNKIHTHTFKPVTLSCGVFKQKVQLKSNLSLPPYNPPKPQHKDVK